MKRSKEGGIAAHEAYGYKAASSISLLIILCPLNFYQQNKLCVRRNQS